MSNSFNGGMSQTAVALGFAGTIIVGLGFLFLLAAMGSSSLTADSLSELTFTQNGDIALLLGLVMFGFGIALIIVAFAVNATLVHRELRKALIERYYRLKLQPKLIKQTMRVLTKRGTYGKVRFSEVVIALVRVDEKFRHKNEQDARFTHEVHSCYEHLSQKHKQSPNTNCALCKVS